MCRLLLEGTGYFQAHQSPSVPAFRLGTILHQLGLLALVTVLTLLLPQTKQLGLINC